MAQPENTPLNISELLACPDCDLLMEKKIPAPGQKTVCPRCGHILERYKRDTVLRSLALALTGLLLYFPAIFMPLMTFNKLGLSESGSVLETIIEFFIKDYFFVAVIVLFSAVIFPFVKLSLLVTVSFCLMAEKHLTFLAKLFRAHNLLDEWAMVEVYLLGIMVTIIKMYQSTEIIYNTGFFCFIGLVILTIASSAAISREHFWDLIETRGGEIRPSGINETIKQITPISNPTAAENNLILCRDCGKLQHYQHDASEKTFCLRCGVTLHLRKPASVARTWALIVSAALFFLPANYLPIMRVEFLGIPSNSTILDGIKLFFEDGSYGIAIIILTASILIPIFKIIGMAIVLLTIKFERPVYLRQKATMFRCIEFIGRWSMLDIFVIALLGVFVNFGFLTSIEAAPAATYFCFVVLATMLAAITFDPRIMWDLTTRQRSRS